MYNLTVDISSTKVNVNISNPQLDILFDIGLIKVRNKLFLEIGKFSRSRHFALI